MSQSSILVMLLLCAFTLLAFVPANNAQSQPLISDVTQKLFPDKPPPPPSSDKKPLIDLVDDSTKKLLPDLVKQVLSQVSPSGLDGLKTVYKDMMEGKTNSVDELIKSLKENSPDIVGAVKMLNMQAQWKSIQIISQLGQKSKDFIKSTIGTITETVKKITDNFKAQPPAVKSDLANAIEMSMPATKPILDNPDVKQKLTLP